MMPLGTNVGLAQATLCSMETQLPPQKKGTLHAQFLAHVCRSQMVAGWMKVPLCTDVNLGPGDVVLDVSQLPHKVTQPQFSVHVYCGQTAGLMKRHLMRK